MGKEHGTEQRERALSAYYCASTGRHVTMYEFIRVCPTDRSGGAESRTHAKPDGRGWIQRANHELWRASRRSRGIWTRSLHQHCSDVERVCMRASIHDFEGLMAHMLRASKEGKRREGHRF